MGFPTFVDGTSGARLSTEQDVKLSLAALTSVFEARGKPRNVAVHSVRGGIFGNVDFVRQAKDNGMRRSMSRTKYPSVNAVIEKSFSTLPSELLDHERSGDT